MSKKITTPLIDASYKGDTEEVIRLLNNGEDIDEQNINGAIALFPAILNNNEKMVKLLLDRGANINIKGEFGPLILAVTEGNENIVNLLLDRGADINEQNIKGDTALIYAVTNNNINMVKLLLNRDANIDKKDINGYTSLIIAVDNGNENIVNLLLDRGADIDVTDNINRVTALIIATVNNNKDMVELLLNRGANINKKDINGYTALIIAVDNGNIDIVTLLLDRGANINEQSNDRDTALVHAVNKQNADIVTLLLNRGADITIKNRITKQTALDLASKQKNKEIKDLIENFIKNDPKAIKARKEAEESLLADIQKEEQMQKKRKAKKKPETGSVSVQPSLSVPESVPEPLEPAPLESEPLESAPLESAPLESASLEPVPVQEKGILYKDEERNNNIRIRISNIRKKYVEYENNLLQINIVRKAIDENNSNKKLTARTMIQKIESASSSETVINLIDLQDMFNNYIADTNRKRGEIENLNNINNQIKAEFGNSYFYIGNPIPKQCAANTDECGILQLQIDLTRENMGEKIKIHGIFPYEGVKVSDKRKVQVDFFDNYQDNSIYDKIQILNFESFFNNKELFDISINKHNKYTVQNVESFINNTIFLSEAIMLKLKSDQVKDRIWYLDTLRDLPPIWGFSHIDEKEHNKIKVYFKVCFNNVKKIWQLCNSDYDPRITTDGFSKSNEILIKKSRRRSRNKSRSKKSIKKSRRRSRIKSRSKKNIKKSRRRSKKV